MTLEKVELKDFKSYTGRCTVGPFARFTCIVGPNGAGKSNILDAIAYALCLEGARLRAQHDGDLIARGADEAEVSVWVSGRAFRRTIGRAATGCLRNTYAVDGHTLSEKEYIAALEELNVLRTAQSVLVAQGDAQQPVVDLLRLIEQACGSDRLAGAYREAEQRARSTAKELGAFYEQRVHCAAELRQHAESAERQREFDRLVDEREDLQAALLRAAVAAKQAEAAALTTRLAEAERLRDTDGHAERLERLNSLRTRAAALQKQFFEAEQERARCQAGEAGAAQAAASAEAAQKEHAALQRTVAQLEREIGNVTVFSATEDAHTSVAERIAAFEEATRSEEQRLSELVVQNFDALARHRERTARLREVAGRAARAESRARGAAAACAERRSRAAALRAEAASLRTRIAADAPDFARLVAEETRLSDEHAALVRALLVAKAKTTDSQRRAVQCATAATLKSVFAGVRGRLVDLAVPTQRRFAVALSALLGAYENAVVVENESVALECVRYAREARACRLTLLPLSRMGCARNSKASEPNGEVKPDRGFNEEGMRGVAAVRCVKCEEWMRGVVETVLGDARVVESHEEAREAAFGAGGTVGRAVTLDGAVYRRSGLISTSGAANRFAEDAVEMLLQRRQSVVDELRVLRERKEAFGDALRAQARADEAEGEAAVLSEEAAREEAEGHAERDWNAELAALREEEEREREELAGFRAAEAAIRQALGEKERELILPVIAPLGVATLTDYKKKLRLLERRNEAVRLLERLAATIQALPAVRSPDNGALAPQAPDRTMAIQTELELAKEQLRRESAAFEAATEQHRRHEQAVLDISLAKMRLESDIKENERILMIAQKSENMSNRYNTVGVEGDTDNVSGSKAESGNNRTSEEITARINEIEQRLAVIVASGTASPNEASLTARYTHLTAAYEDAKQRAANAKSRFFEIRRERFNRFTGCFNRLAASIAGAYAQLAEAGSSAALIYEGDPFTNGVKYFLMPPGKRFVEFNQLSGGERSLALMAFIFTLGAYAGTRFFLLDEADAALDRRNVAQLARCAGAMDTQILAVSLKTEFFQHADALVGVYQCPQAKKSCILTYKLRG